MILTLSKTVYSHYFFMELHISLVLFIRPLSQVPSDIVIQDDFYEYFLPSNVIVSFYHNLIKNQFLILNVLGAKW